MLLFAIHNFGEFFRNAKKDLKSVTKMASIEITSTYIGVLI